MKKITIVALSIMFLAACQKNANEVNPGSTEPNDVASTSNTLRTPIARPFTATLYATADGSSAPTPCTGDVPFAAPDFLMSGTATHLGMLNSQLSRLHHEGCELSISTMLLTTSVTVDLVSASGDLIHCTGDDVVNVASLLTATGTTGVITGTWTVTGGTGRFVGATGSLTINGIVDFATNSFSCACVGTITY
jgi:hypothetical protein